MKRNQLIKNGILAALLLLLPVTAHSVNIIIRVKSNNEGKSRCPSMIVQEAKPITYYNNVEKVYSITSRISIPEAVITVTKDGAVISNEQMPINREYIIEYNFSNDESGEYMITISVDDIVKSVENIIVE